MFTALTDIGQPYSCNQWGNIGQNGLPMIVNDGNGWGNHFFNWFNSNSAMPSNVFIDHNMTVYYKSNNIIIEFCNKWIYLLKKHGYQFKMYLTIKLALMFEPNYKKVINLGSISDGIFPL